MNTAPTFDVDAIRADFPILNRDVNGQSLAYLDSAATSQRPIQVTEAMREFTQQSNANISRSVHTLGAEATEAYEGARARIADFIGAPAAEEIVFVKNSTEGINLLAYAFQNASAERGADARFQLGPGDEIVITEMEHHSNLVPWQQLAERTGATLKWLEITDHGRIELENLDEVITDRCKIVSFVHVSNLLGTVNPTEAIVKRAREVGALVAMARSNWSRLRFSNPTTFGWVAPSN